MEMAEDRDQLMGRERAEIFGAGVHHRLHAICHEMRDHGHLLQGLAYTEEKAAVGSS